MIYHLGHLDKLQTVSFSRYAVCDILSIGPPRGLQIVSCLGIQPVIYHLAHLNKLQTVSFSRYAVCNILYLGPPRGLQVVSCLGKQSVKYHLAHLAINKLVSLHTITSQKNNIFNNKLVRYCLGFSKNIKKKKSPKILIFT